MLCEYAHYSGYVRWKGDGGGGKQLDLDMPTQDLHIIDLISEVCK